MTKWYEYDKWNDDEILPDKKVIPERTIKSWKILEHVLPDDSTSIMYEIELDCGHKVIQLVPNNGIPKGLYRLCERCIKL